MMLPNTNLPDLFQVQYPLYIQPIKLGLKIVYKPDLEGGSFYTTEGTKIENKALESNFKAILGVASYVIEGYLYKEGVSVELLAQILSSPNNRLPSGIKFLAYDCVPIKDWEQQNCSLKYEWRLKNLRVLLNDSIADYSKFIDLETILVESPSEIKKWYKYCLTNGADGISIRSMSGLYRWGIAESELFELRNKELENG